MRKRKNLPLPAVTPAITPGYNPVSLYLPQKPKMVKGLVRLGAKVG